MLEKLFKLGLIPQDKACHVIWGMFTFMILVHFDVTLACVAVVIQAVVKELYDYTKPLLHTADVWDAVATIVGGAMGFLCWFQF